MRLPILVGICACLVSNLGCQSLHPFAQKTRQGIASARQWANGGLEAFHNGKLDQAKGLFSRAAEQEPDDVSVRANLARTLFKSGDTQQAISELQQAVDLSRNDPRLLVELGEMYLSAGHWIPARRQVELARNIDHHNPAVWVLSGKTHKAKGDYDKALADFQKALGYAPDAPGVQMHIVNTYQKMGQPLRALSSVEQLLSQQPADALPEEAVIAKGVALMKLDQHSHAIETLQSASEKKNASSEVFVRLSQAQLLAGQISQARLTLNRGKAAFPRLAVFDQLVNELQTAEQRVAQADSRNLSSYR